MAPLSEVKTIFTIDLAPYMAGLKTALVMTQQTGVQMKPLLNLQIDKANFSELEKTFDEYLKQVKASVPAADDAVAASRRQSGARRDESESTDRAKKSHEEHAVSLNKGKREALESFGAIAFLTQGLIQVAAAEDRTNKDLQTLNRGLSEGISAGFGLAGTMSMLGIATGGTAVAIGAVVTVGVALLAFLDDGTKKTKAYSDALTNFGESFRGASVKELKEWRENLRQGWEQARSNVEAQKKVIDELNKGARQSPEGAIRRAQIIDAETEKLKKLEEQQTAQYISYKTLDDQVTKSVINNAEVRKLAADASIAAIRDQYDRQRAERRKAAKDDIEAVNQSSATESEKANAITQINNRLKTELNDIKETEENERTEKARREADKRKQIAEEEFRFQSEMMDQSLADVINRLKLRGLAAGKTEDEINLDVIDRKKIAADAELNILKKKEADGKVLSNQEIIEKEKLEATLSGLQYEGEITRQKIAADSKKKIIESWQQIGSYLSQTFGSLYQLQSQHVTKILGDEKKRRQDALDDEQKRRQRELEEEEKSAKNHAKTSAEREQLDRTYSDRKAELDSTYAAKRSQLDADMDAEARDRMRTMFTLQKFAQIANAVVATYSAATAALAPPPLGLGPVFGPAIAATAIAAGLANIAVISAQEVPGLAAGSKVTRPTFALIGEAGPEIVAPERTFLDVFRTELGPRIMDILLPQFKASALSAAGGGGVVFNVNIGNYYGTEDHFEKVLKPVIEDKMRQVGTKDASSLFVNTKS